MKFLKYFLIILLLFTFVITTRKQIETFLNPKNIQTNSVKAGAIPIYHDPDDYDYRLLGIKTKAICSRKDRNLSNAIKYHKPIPEKAGSIQFNKKNYIDGIPTVSSLPGIDRDDFQRFPTFKYKKRKFPPIEKTNYYPYESILPKKKKQSQKNKDKKSEKTNFEIDLSNIL